MWYLSEFGLGSFSSFHENNGFSYFAKMLHPLYFLIEGETVVGAIQLKQSKTKKLYALFDCFVIICFLLFAIEARV